MTQELIANMLSVRNEGTTEAAGNAQKDGLIHSRREGFRHLAPEAS